MKVDDDTVPNMYMILEFFAYLAESYSQLSNTYFCEILSDSKAKVDRRPGFTRIINKLKIIHLNYFIYF